jgi:hypothetical protein
MPKQGKEKAPGIDWAMVSQSVALGVMVVVLSWLAIGLGLHQLPLVGVIFQFFTPLALVVLMTYFRSQQRTRGQAMAEGLFAGCILLVVLSLIMAVLSTLMPATQ